MIMVTGWRYYYRRWLGWVPLQFCIACGKPYWGGFPAFGWDRMVVWGRRRLGVQWMPWWREYCSRECSRQEYG